MSDNTHDSELFLGRQPILDKEQRLVAYELLFRTSHHNYANVTDGVRATATVIVNAFAELSVRDALGDCRGYINVDEAFLFNDALELLPRQSVVLEILETVPPTPEVIRRCRDLKARGFTLALDDLVQVIPEYKELLDLVEIVKVDIQLLDHQALAKVTGKLAPLRKQMLAEKVDSREQMELCRQLGYTLFQGYYFARPSIIAGKKLQHSQLALITLMGLLLADAETADLEAALKQEPGLSVNLLRITNSVGVGGAVRITSLGHAITVLGRRQLQRWLQLLLFASRSAQGLASPLLQLAATRGRLLEILAGELRRGDTPFADQAFMAGIMSLMPALVGQSIRDIVTPLGLAEPVRQALCENDGPLGALLQMAEALEQDDYPTLSAILERFPGLTSRRISQCQAQALAWANSIGRGADRGAAA